MLQLFQAGPGDAAAVRRRDRRDGARTGLAGVASALQRVVPARQGAPGWAAGRGRRRGRRCWHRLRPQVGGGRRGRRPRAGRSGRSARALRPPRRRSPANDFGLCRLGPDAGSAGPARADRVAARSASRRPPGAARAAPVLTFADLWGAPPLGRPGRHRRGRRAPRASCGRLSVDTEARAVDLQMMTTDLTHGRPLAAAGPASSRYKDRAGGQRRDAALRPGRAGALLRARRDGAPGARGGVRPVRRRHRRRAGRDRRAATCGASRSARTCR